MSSNGKHSHHSHAAAPVIGGAVLPAGRNHSDEMKKAWSDERRNKIRPHRTAANYRLFPRVFGEFMGTMLLVYMAGGATAAASSTIVPQALGYGLGLGVLTLVLLEVSYAHMNPFVTLAVALSGELQLGWLDTLLYWLAQFSGSVVGAALLRVTFGGASTLGRPQFGVGIDIGQAFAIEAVFGFLTVATYLFTVLEGRGSWTVAVVIGFVPVVGTFVGRAISGASINPYYAFGTSTFVGFIKSQHWVYWVAPFAGAALALAMYWLGKARISQAAGMTPKGAVRRGDTPGGP